jgi:hypothetical protein
MEVVDEDALWRWIPPGSQFCEKIGSIVVLLGDMMQFDPLEFVLELAHLLAVCCHEGALARGLLHDLVDNQLRVTTDVEPCGTELDGDAESVDEGLVLCGVV